MCLYRTAWQVVEVMQEEEAEAEETWGGAS